MSIVEIQQSPNIVELAKKGISILGLISIWYLLAESGMVGSLPNPVSVSTVSIAVLISGRLLTPFMSSMLHIYIPFSLAVLIGIPLGIAIGWNKTLKNLIFPSIELLRPIPPLAWLPVVILVLPTSRLGVMFITFLGAFFPILLNTMSGVKKIEKDYIKSVRSLGGSQKDVLQEVIFPAALPSIFTGLIVGMGLGWVNLVAAEMIADEGIGHYLWLSYAASAYEELITSIIIIGIMGYISSESIRMAGNKYLKWEKLD